MLLTTLIARLQDSLAKRARYLRLISEIESMTTRDLIDIRGDKSEMLANAHKQIYG